MKKFFLLFAPLGISVSSAQIDFQLLIPDYLSKPKEEWLSYCEYSKSKYASQAHRFQLFDESDHISVDISEQDVGFISLDGFRIPVDSTNTSPKKTYKSYEQTNQETLDIYFTDEYQIFIRKYPRDVKSDLWLANENQSEEVASRYKKLSKEFYPNGWDSLTLLLDSYTVTPQDLDCTSSSIKSDMKTMYLLSIKFEGGETVVINLLRHGIRGLLTTESLEKYDAISLLISTESYLYEIVYIIGKKSNIYQAILTMLLGESDSLVDKTIRLESLNDAEIMK